MRLKAVATRIEVQYDVGRNMEQTIGANGSASKWSNPSSGLRPSRLSPS